MSAHLVADAGRIRPAEPAEAAELGLGERLLQPLYRIYEHHLRRQIMRSAMPGHVGLILDGNRRFALRSGMTDPAAAYRRGAQKLDAVLAWCSELGIGAVTLWVLSTDNFARPAAEISGILAAVEGKLARLAVDPAIHHRRVRVRAVGRLELLPSSTVAAIRAAEAATAGYDGLTLTIAAAYGGRQEIADAVTALIGDGLRRGLSLAELAAEVTPEAIGRHLYAPDLPDPDLIIRTSGEVRLSGFLLWQSAYSEFYFTDVFWPAFRRTDFLRAVRAYQQRKRRHGR